jgi:5-hydroxyisourate hydrolase-like protein (transthyretin family)
MRPQRHSTPSPHLTSHALNTPPHNGPPTHKIRVALLRHNQRRLCSLQRRLCKTVPRPSTACTASQPASQLTPNPQDDD